MRRLHCCGGGPCVPTERETTASKKRAKLLHLNSSNLYSTLLPRSPNIRSDEWGKVQLGGGLGKDSGLSLKEVKAFRPETILAFVAALFVGVPLASAQEGDVPAWRLDITPAVPAPEDGHYYAADGVEFWVDHNGEGENARLRFVGEDEIFYLTTDPSTLGGRVLKYDTGDVALAVSSWGGVTLYTRGAPNGLPAERMGDAPPLDPEPLNAGEVQDFAQTLARTLEERDSLSIGFAANWDRISRVNRVRALAADSMRNATNALAELASVAETKSEYAERIKVIRIIASNSTDIRVIDDTVTISLNANGGPWERPSSRAIIEAIETSP